jgi:hypothetical protein
MYEVFRDKDLQWLKANIHWIHSHSWWSLKLLRQGRLVRILKLVKESDLHFVRVRFIAIPSKKSNVVLWLCVFINLCQWKFQGITKKAQFSFFLMGAELNPQWVDWALSWTHWDVKKQRCIERAPSWRRRSVVTAPSWRGAQLRRRWVVGAELSDAHMSGHDMRVVWRVHRRRS